MRRLMALLLVAACSAATTTEATTTTAAAAPTTIRTTTTTTRPTTTTTTQATTTTMSVEEVRETTRKILLGLPNVIDDVERVDVAEVAGDGRIVVELHTLWASEDSQAEVSWNVVTTLADIFVPLGLTGAGASQIIVGSDAPVLVVRTVSTNGDYPYSSETPFAVLDGIADRRVSYEEWVEQSGAGFD